MTERERTPAGSVPSGRRERGIVPAPLMSSTSVGLPGGLPARPPGEVVSAEEEGGGPSRAESRARSAAYTAGGETSSAALPGPSSPPRGESGRSRRKKRGRPSAPSDSSPEAAGHDAPVVSRARARRTLVRRHSPTPTTRRAEVGRALELLDAVEALRVRPTHREGDGVPVRDLIRSIGGGLSPVRWTLRAMREQLQGTSQEERVGELEGIVRTLREDNAALAAEVRALRHQMERMREEIRPPSSRRTREPPGPSMEAGRSGTAQTRPVARTARPAPATRRDATRGGGRRGRLPPVDNIVEFPPLPSTQGGWTVVDRRGRGRGVARPRGGGGGAVTRGAAGGPVDRRGGRLMPPPRAPAPARAASGSRPGPGPGAAGGRGARRQARRRAVPRTAAVTITATGARSYAEIMGDARRMVSLEDLGLQDRLTIRRAINGGLKLEVSGADGADLADRLARDLEDAVGEVAKIARPAKLAELRVVGLDDSATSEEVVRAICAKGECPPSSVTVGQVRRAADGMGTLWVRLPLAAAKAVVVGGRIRAGWAHAGVRLLAERPLQCFACLGFGHAAAACRAEVDRRGRCFHCGGLGHVARGCTNRVQCPLCHDAGRRADHRMGGRVCPAVRGGRTRRKGPPNVTGLGPAQPGGEVGAGPGAASRPATRGRTARGARGGRAPTAQVVAAAVPSTEGRVGGTPPAPAPLPQRVPRVFRARRRAGPSVAGPSRGTEQANQGGAGLSESLAPVTTLSAITGNTSDDGMLLSDWDGD